jgi:hypothetical protein
MYSIIGVWGVTLAVQHSLCEPRERSMSPAPASPIMSLRLAATISCPRLLRDGDLITISSVAANRHLWWLYCRFPWWWLWWKYERP